MIYTNKIRKLFDEIQKDDIEYLIESLRENIENTENSITQRFFDLYISTIIENDKLKYPMMRQMENSNGIFCLGLYLTSSPNENKENEVDSSMMTYLQREKPFFMGKQIMIQSFFMEDIKDRKILSVLPDIDGEWYALLEGGIKLYLNNDISYQKEKISSYDVGIFTNLEINTILQNPVYAYKRHHEPHELFEEWNSVFLYALAILKVEYEVTKLKQLYMEFLEYIENNVCDTLIADKGMISEEDFLEALKKGINYIREYLNGKDEVGISKNLIILLRSRYCYLPTILKLIEKYYPQQVLEIMHFTQFSDTKWKQLLEQVEKVQNNYEKGIVLEDVANYFINCIKGLQVTKRRSKTDNEEMDLVCCNLYSNMELAKLGPLVLIECKNWTRKTETKEIRNLSYIMDKKGVSTLLLFVKNDITSGAKEEIIKQAAHNKFILVFNLQDLSGIDNEKIKPIDLLNLKWEQLEDEISNRMENLM